MRNEGSIIFLKAKFLKSKIELQEMNISISYEKLNTEAYSRSNIVEELHEREIIRKTSSRIQPR